MTTDVRRTIALFALLPACSRAPAPAVTEAGAPKPKRAHLVDGGPPPDARVTCGETVCGEPTGGDVLDEIACCLPSGGCGIRSPLLGNRCLEPAQPGSVDRHCPSFSTPSGAIAQGCCNPSGRCGVFDRFGDLGCVAADTSDAAARCEYDPSSTCRSVVGIVCDGPEDCGAGNVCCARLNVGLYDAFACFPSCKTPESGGRGVWLEVCHRANDCRSPFDRCGTTSGLPPPLARCFPVEPVKSEGGADAAREASATHEASAGGGPPGAGGGTGTAREASTDAAGSADAGMGISCGAAVCEVGETCCSRVPGEPYCAARGETCACAGPRPSDR